MKRKIYIPLALITIAPPIMISLVTTSCSSDTIKKHMTDQTSYDSIIKPAPAQTVTSNDKLIELSEAYLNDPQKVAGD
jgi:hypothetical protein